jgi:uncharacterized lipoprotein YmbA
MIFFLLRPVLIVLLSLGLFGCAVTSPTIQYLQLSAGDLPAPEGSGVRVIMNSVSMPDYLLRGELLLRDSPYSFRYRNDQRWAEPLDMGIQRVLARRLKTDLNTRELIVFPQPRWEDSHWELQIDVRSFELQEGRAVLAAAGSWTWRAGSNNRASAGSAVADREYVDFEASRALDESGADAAIALSALLWEFADALAEPLMTKKGM